MIYDKHFYEVGRGGMVASARAMVPAIYETLKPTSIIDFGCGDGWWLNEFCLAQPQLKDHLVGIEGESDAQPIEGFEFHRADIGEPQDFGQFDLALCLEVAEHLPENKADTLVSNLCNASNVVIFSAAIPKQTGVNHINEQWPSYWTPKFKQQNYNASSYFRYLFWNDARIESWYRQNIILFVKQGGGVMFDGVYGQVLDAVHPALWSYFRK